MLTVVKLGGNAPRELLQEIAALGRVVLVHGGGSQLTRLLERLQVPTRFEAGQRVTDAATLEAAEMVLAGQVNKELSAQLQTLGIKAVGLAGCDGGLLQTELRQPEMGLVGTVVAVNGRLLQVLLEAGYLPVVAPLGLGPDGRRHNVNADVAASELAVALGASRLVMLSDVAGVLQDGQVVPELDVQGARNLIESGQASAGMICKLQTAITAAQAGLSVTIGNRLTGGTLLSDTSVRQL